MLRVPSAKKWFPMYAVWAPWVTYMHHHLLMACVEPMHTYTYIHSYGGGEGALDLMGHIDK